MLPILRETRDSSSWFNPDAVIADPGYDKYELYEGIVNEFHAEPVIKHMTSLPDITGSPVTPFCPASLPLIYRGSSKDKGLRYQCPEKAGRAVCPLAQKCPINTIWMHPVHDYRRFGYRISRTSDEWKELYSQRTASERVNSRLKDKRRLDSHCFRGLRKIDLHCSLSMLVMNSMALAKARAGQVDEIRFSSRRIP